MLHGFVASSGPMNISYSRRLSAPYSLTTSSGLMTLPRALDILSARPMSSIFVPLSNVWPRSLTIWSSVKGANLPAGRITQDANFAIFLVDAKDLQSQLVDGGAILFVFDRREIINSLSQDH